MDAISLPAEASCYYSVCGSRPGLRGALILDGDALIVFGDERLARLQEGDRVSASVYELCCGPPLVTFPVTVLELASDEVGLSEFADVSATASSTSTTSMPKPLGACSPSKP